MMTKRATTALLASLLPPTAAAPAQARETSPGPQAARGSTAVEALFALDMSPGMAVAVVQGSEVVDRRGFGVADLETRRPVTASTVFYIASTTKAFTAFAAAPRAARRAGPDAPLGPVLPSVALSRRSRPARSTARIPLTDTHGITDGGPIVIRTAYTGDFTNELLLRLLGEYEASPKGRASPTATSATTSPAWRSTPASPSAGRSCSPAKSSRRSG